MKPFTDECLYDFDVKPEHHVLDVGGFDGTWASEIERRYNPHILIYEPQQLYATILYKRFRENPKVAVWAGALGGSNRQDIITIKGSMTGYFADQGPKEVTEVIDVIQVLITQDFQLACLNCEGSEYEILDRIIQCGMAPRIRNLIIQFHPVVQDCEERRERIVTELKETHEPLFAEKFVWEGFTLK